MTPDEIRVAIRMLGQRVVYDTYNEVVYTDHGYEVVEGSSIRRPLFGKDGKFLRNWAGRILYSEHLFQVAPGKIPTRVYRKVAKK